MNTWSHQKLEEARKDSPLEPAEGTGPDDAAIDDFWPPNCERWNFCCLKPLSVWWFATAVTETIIPRIGTYIRLIVSSPSPRAQLSSRISPPGQRGWDLGPGGTLGSLIILGAFQQVLVPIEKNLQHIDLFFLLIVLLEAPMIMKSFTSSKYLMISPATQLTFSEWNQEMLSCSQGHWFCHIANNPKAAHL